MGSRMRWTVAAVSIAVLLLLALLLANAPGRSDVASDAGAHVTADANTTTDDPRGAAVERDGQHAARAFLFHERVPTNAELEMEARAEEWWAQYSRRIARHVELLIERGDARSLYHAYLLMPSTDWVDDSRRQDPEYFEAAWTRHLQDSMDILRLARERAPDDPQLAWLEAMNCHAATAGCDPSAATLDLARMEPDNARGALLALDRAFHAGDMAAVDAWLTRAAQADFYDMGYGAAALELLTVLEGVPLPPMDAALRSSLIEGSGLKHDGLTWKAVMSAVSAGGIASAQAIPPLMGLRQTCGAADVTQARIVACHRVWQHLADSDTVIAHAIALPQLIQLTGDPVQRRGLQERLRHYAWVRDSMIAHADLTYMLDSWRLGELVAGERLLQRRGITMPAGWLPDHPIHRSLILTGRPPPGD